MEAMMRINTPLPADSQLDRVARQFEQWRRNRSHPSERIPQTLWDQATALAAGRPYSQVAKHLRLSPNDLKKHLTAQQQPTPQGPAPALSFVEVPLAPASCPASSGTEIELQRADGARLRLRSGESTLSLAAVVRAFLEAH
jgi:hypothetical protein